MIYFKFYLTEFKTNKLYFLRSTNQLKMCQVELRNGHNNFFFEEPLYVYYRIKRSNVFRAFYM